MEIICSDRNCTFWVVFLTVHKTRNNAYICDLYTTLQQKICIIYENTKKLLIWNSMKIIKIYILEII